MNVTVPAVDPVTAHGIVLRSGCATAKVKVAEPGQVLAEDEARVGAALAGLPDDHRRADEMRYLGGRSVGEIAAALGKTKAAVAGLLQRGLRALREQLGDAAPDLPPEG